jgi:hypothetical protein
VDIGGQAHCRRGDRADGVDPPEVSFMRVLHYSATIFIPLVI